VSRLFSYVVVADSGFAPNPFFGLCTLACCKPRIRKAIGDRLLLESGHADIAELRRSDPGFVRRQNVWVIGLAGASLRDRPRRSVVYVMHVTDVLDFESYYDEHPEKRPVRTGGVTGADPVWHGDAIYTGNDPLTARQVTPCAHSNGVEEDHGSKKRDLGGRYVLVSDRFIYFGQDAPYIPLEEELHHSQGHHSSHPPEVLTELESWLNGPWVDLFNDAPGAAAAAGTATARGCRGSR
jgi:hypothetical protein